MGASGVAWLGVLLEDILFVQWAGGGGAKGGGEADASSFEGGLGGVETF